MDRTYLKRVLFNNPTFEVCTLERVGRHILRLPHDFGLTWVEIEQIRATHGIS
jgi:hypothetical protein